METAARRAPRRFGPRSFRATIVASTVGLMTVSMIIVGLFIQLLLSRAADNDVDEVLHQRADSAIAVISDASATALTVPQDSLEPGIVVYDTDGEVLAGSVGDGPRDLAQELAASDRERVTDGPGGVVRLLAVPFETPSGDRGVLVVSQDTTPYERSERYALYATGILAALVIATTALIALRVTRKALEPVARMAERAAEWSERDLTSRFALGPPTNELAALGETLDHLLDRVASAILSEQRLTAELAHELPHPPHVDPGLGGPRAASRRPGPGRPPGSGADLRLRARDVGGDHHPARPGPGRVAQLAATYVHGRRPRARAGRCRR